MVRSIHQNVSAITYSNTISSQRKGYEKDMYFSRIFLLFRLAVFIVMKNYYREFMVMVTGYWNRNIWWNKFRLISMYFTVRWRIVRISSLYLYLDLCIYWIKIDRYLLPSLILPQNSTWPAVAVAHKNVQVSLFYSVFSMAQNNFNAKF